MSIKENMKALVQLQTRELDLLRIDGEMTAIARDRAALREQIAAAEAVVSKAEKDVEEARAEAKRLDLDLKAAEEKVSKYKDQMHSVKTNEQLWALQEEIGHAEGAVGDIEDKILEQLEVADSLTGVIGEKKAELVQEKKRIDGEISVADAREKELQAQKAEVEAAIAELSEQVPADLLKKYEGIRALRNGVGVAEVLDETCLACNTKVRPQLFVDTYNFVDVLQCENCKRIIYVAERLGIAGPVADSADAVAQGAPDAPDAAGVDAAPPPVEPQASSTVDVTS